jgi:hypothetical protein
MKKHWLTVSAVAAIAAALAARAFSGGGGAKRQGAGAAAVEAAADAPTDGGWPDRRPIDVVMLCDLSYRSRENPRGWNPVFHGNLDAAAPDYQRRFRATVERFVDGCVRRATWHGAQAALFWDVEGQEFPHTQCTYIGDPRVLPPEMDWRDPAELESAIREGRPASSVPTTALRLFRKFTAAGMLVGGTIRPQVCVDSPYGPRQVQGGEPLEILTDKVNYARRELGWRVFYVDSSLSVYAFAGAKDDGRELHYLPAELFATLAGTFPDCLFVPEFAGQETARVPRVAPLRYQGEPSRQAFEVLKPHNQRPKPEDEAEYVRAMRAGAVPLLAATWDSPENAWVFRRYRQAQRRD